MTGLTGTATVVLGDVAGSTRLWDEHHDAMSHASNRLHEILDELAATHRGHRPREQGEGDNLVAVFASAHDAAAFALAVPHALDQEAWRDDIAIGMRLGLHTGDVEWSEQNGYLGPTFNRAARIRDLGHAGMVLCSQTTRDIVADATTDGLRLVDHGHQQLRDLSRAEQVFQLLRADDDRTFAPLKSVTSLPNNLPVPVDSLVGRDADIEHLARLFADHRLVTLTGPGGAGKTRLAQHVASELLRYAPDGAWWVDLMPVAEDGQVPLAIAEAAGITEVPPGRQAAPTLASGLGDRELLLVVDNCEHVIDAVADTLELVLARCPNVRVMATSRENVDIAGEHAVRVRPLTSPEVDSPSLDDLRASAATALFLERATTLDADALDTGQRRSVAAICDRLDGMPLAIELAAARTRLLSVGEIEQGLDDRFGLLTTVGRRRQSRQRTLEASVAWSWDLLQDDEAAMLARLSVFPAAFDLDGAVAVGGLGNRASALDLLTALVDKSLVAVRPAKDGARYRLLESIRHYGLDRLAERGEQDLARDAHLDHVLARLWDGTGAERDGSSRMAEIRARQWVPEDDIRAASQWARASGRGNDGVDLYWPTYVTRVMQGTYGEALRALDGIVEEGGLDLRHEARARSLIASYLASTGSFAQTQAQLDAAVDAADRMTDEGDPYIAFSTFGPVLMARAWMGQPGADDARRALAFIDAHGLGDSDRAILGAYASAALCFGGFEQEALEVAVSCADAARRAGLPHFEALNAGYAAGNVMRCGRHWDEHVRLRDRALAAIPQSNPRLAVSVVSLTGAISEALTAHVDSARTLHQLVVDAAGPPGTGSHAIALTSASALTLVSARDEDVDLEVARQARRAWAGADNLYWRLIADSFLAEALLRAGDPEESLAVAEGVATELDGLDANVLPFARTWTARSLLPALLRADRPAQAIDHAARVAARARQAGSLGTFGHLGESLPDAHLATERPGEAAWLLGAMHGVHERNGWGRNPRAVTQAAAQEAATRELLGEQAFDQAFREGAAATAAQALDRIAGHAPVEAPGDRPVSGWDALTPAEADVAAKVAEGLTNKQVGEALFVSENTVKTHLKSVYAKLHVSSRAALATAVAQEATQEDG